MSRFIYQLHEIFNNQIIPVKIKPLKKLNNEIIIQYLTDAIVIFNESFVVGVSKLSDVMSKSEVLRCAALVDKNREFLRRSRKD
jgi:hypothetical protein